MFQGNSIVHDQWFVESSTGMATIDTAQSVLRFVFFVSRLHSMRIRLTMKIINGKDDVRAAILDHTTTLRIYSTL